MLLLDTIRFLRKLIIVCLIRYSLIRRKLTSKREQKKAENEFMAQFVGGLIPTMLQRAAVFLLLK